MRILWLCNVIVPKICEAIGLDGTPYGGWLNQLAELNDENQAVDFAIAAPCYGKKEYNNVIWGNGSRFYSFVDTDKCDTTMVKRFETIISDFDPDIVHIFGTEYPHSLAMVKAFGNPNRTIIQIQGMASKCAEHYLSGLPWSSIFKKSFRDFCRCDGLKKAQKRFYDHSIYEKVAIQNVNHVIGRTEWDQSCVWEINPSAKYYKINEILRKSFYSGDQWDFMSCEKNTIFMTQASYPIKGLHFALEALSLLKRDYHDVKLRIAGPSVIDKGIKSTTYDKYIISLIHKYDLSSNVEFLGNLSETDVKQEMLKANVYLSASTVENESNSLSEARILGVPCVASYVGGVTDRINHGVDGFFYPVDEYYRAAYYINRCFMFDDSVREMSAKSIENQSRINDIQTNYNSLLEVYHSILE